MKKTIYAVTAGSYSDYRIIGIFSTRERANDFIKYAPDNSYNEIEEYELDSLDAVTSMIKRGYSVWRVLMLRDGTVEEIKRCGTERYQVKNAEHHAIWKRTKADFYKDKGVPDVLQSYVWAKTEKQAIKIVNEKRARMIASGEFK